MQEIFEINLSSFRDTAYTKAVFAPNPISQTQIKFHCSENAAPIHVQWVFFCIQQTLPPQKYKKIKLWHQQRLKPT